jgi:peptidoglycan/xylan/chitin deacetylase (PgdA/CDA1 family)
MMTPSGFDISPSRMRLKKFARRVAVGLGRSLRLPDLRGNGSIRVLTYHRFGFSPFDPCCLQPQVFEEQLDWLSEHSTVLTPDLFDAVMAGRSPAPPNAVLISIDDGHESVAAYALPALNDRRLAAVLFVCPGLVENRHAGPQPYGGFMGWDALADAAAEGHTIAAHGYSHRSLGRLPLPQAIAEIDQATEALENRLRFRSPFFSFPFGTRADYSADLADTLAKRGFRYCFTSTHGRCRPESGSVLLPRIKIEGGNEADLFPHIARGAMDHWRFVDHALYHLQQRGRM